MFLGRPDEETGLSRAASPTRVQGQLPGRGLVYCFKGTRLEVRHHRSTVFFRRCEPFGRLHRTNHHRSLVFSDGVGHRCRRFFAELVSFGLGYMKTLSSQVRLKNPCFFR